MYRVSLGIILLVLGVAAASNSLHIVKRAVRVWPNALDRRGAEAMASYEFLIRFTGLVVALVGIGLILVEFVAS